MSKNNQAKFQAKQRDLLDGKAHEKRVAFLHTILNGTNAEFRQIFDDWGLDADPDLDLPEKPWDEDTFRSHPWSKGYTEENYRTFSAIPANDLRRVATWYSIHIKMVEAGKLEGKFFGYARAAKAPGGSNIENALDSGKTKEISSCTRNVLRNLGGVVERGHRTAFLNCPTCKFYWNYRLAQETAETFKEVELKAAYEVFRGSGWEAFIEAIISRMTIVADARIRPALIAYFTNVMGSSKVNKESVNQVIKEVGQITNHRHLGFLDARKVYGILQEELSH